MAFNIKHYSRDAFNTYIWVKFVMPHDTIYSYISLVCDKLIQKYLCKYTEIWDQRLQDPVENV